MLTYPVQKQRLDVVKHFLQPAGVEPARWGNQRVFTPRAHHQ
ncbi:transcriptional activator MetR [Vibrio cholerae]|nr:transcriptional activator MetR [Vibrio cholerae]